MDRHVRLFLRFGGVRVDEKRGAHGHGRLVEATSDDTPPVRVAVGIVVLPGHDESPRRVASDRGVVAVRNSDLEIGAERCELCRPDARPECKQSTSQRQRAHHPHRPTISPATRTRQAESRTKRRRRDDATRRYGIATMHTPHACGAPPMLWLSATVGFFTWRFSAFPWSCL